MKIPSIPQFYRHVNRWREIVAVLSKYGLAGWLSRFGFEFAKGFFKNRDGEAISRMSREARIRRAVEELGPTFIKFGQILSTRPDIVGFDLAEELKQLQDNAPANASGVIRRTIEGELNASIDELFAEFDDEPLASASIAQVHRARLRSGDRVVVKVQHPGIERRMRIDLEMMAGLAQIAERVPELAAYRPTAVVGEFRRQLRRELDFKLEERHLVQFRHQYARNRTVRIPKPYAELTTARVLTMERLDGVKLAEFAYRPTPGLDPQELALRGTRVYLDMIFARGCYHADPHPGNLVLMKGNVVGMLDFGMVGRLDEALREDIEEMLMAIVDRDAYVLTSIIMRVGATPPGFDDALLGVDVMEFVDHYANQPIESFDLSGALREMIELVRRYRIVLPAPLAMLIKVLIMLEGTGRMLCPKFSLMEVMEPYRRSMLWRRLSPTRQAKRIRRIFYDTEQLFEMLPRRIMDILAQVQSGQFDVHLDHRGLEPSVNRLVLGLMTSALFLGSAIMLSRDVPPMIGGVSVFGATGCVISFALGLRLFRAIRKSGHLDRRK